MTRGLLVLAVLGMVALAYLGMLRAWRQRVKLQQHIPAPQPALTAPVVAGPWPARYLGATHAGRWLDRIDAHGLGARSDAAVSVTAEGPCFTRVGDSSFGFLWRDVIGVRADKAIAGRAYEDAGIVVLTVRLGDVPVDLGLRFPDTSHHLAALAALAHHPEVAS